MKSPTKIFTAIAVSFSMLGISVPANAVTANPELNEYINQDWTNSQWALNTIQAQQAWNVATGDGIKVAVIDTGIDSTHPDLINNTVDGYAFVSNEPTFWQPVSVAKADAVDLYGHGTHVAGIIGAVDNGTGVTGVAPKVTLMPINLLQMMFEADEVRVLYAIGESIDLAVAEESDVINISLGSVAIESNVDTVPDSYTDEYIAAQQFICDAITNAKNAGTITVVASGNDGYDGNYLSAPAYCDDAISVSATDITNRNVFFSSFDETVDIAAPGVDILSTLSRKASNYFRYGQMSGTSMATPVIVGSLAVLKEAYPTDTVDQLVQRLYDTAVDEGTGGVDAYYGHGIVDLAAAVGETSPRSSIPDAQTLISSTRYAYNADALSYVASWNQPLGASLPESYTLKIYDRYGSLYDTVTVSGSAVRAVFSIKDYFKYSYWITVEANYNDHTVKAPPVFQQGVPVDIKDFAITPLGNGAYPDGVNISFSPISILEADAVVYGITSYNLYDYQIQANADENGDFTINHDIYFNDPALWVKNTTWGDFDITVYGNTASNVGWGEYGNMVSGVINARNPMGLAANSVNKKKLVSDVIINNSQADIACGQAVGGDCSKAKFQFKYTVTSKVNKKLVTKTYKQVVTKAEAMGYDWVTGSDIYGLHHKAPFDVTSQTKTVSLQVNIVNANGKIGDNVLPTKALVTNYVVVERL